MSNFVTISALSMAEPDFSSFPKNYSIYEKEIKKFLKEQIDKALCDSPDLIVFPECASQYVKGNRDRDLEELKEYYKYLGDSIEEFLKPIAVQNNTNIAYGSIRYAYPDSDKPYRNSTIYIDRKGEICGVYDKNHLLITEYTLSDVGYGDKADLISLDFGNVATAICFDLNFDELLNKYKLQKPDLTVFSSMYHGGLRQAQWAYSCRSYFVGAVCELESSILNPCGEIVASTSNYTDCISATVNLDYRLCHLDYNKNKFDAAKNKYKDSLTIHIPPYIGVALLTCNNSDFTVNDIIREFEIETLDEYFNRCLSHRHEIVK